MNDEPFIIQQVSDDYHDLHISTIGDDLIFISTNSREMGMSRSMARQLRLALEAIENGYSEAITTTGLRLREEKTARREEQIKLNCEERLKAEAASVDLLVTIGLAEPIKRRA